MWTDLVFNLIVLAIASVRCDELLLHPRGVELRLHHLQLPQPQRRLDPSHRQRPYRAAMEGTELAARRRRASSLTSMRSSWRRCQGVEPDGAVWAGLITAALIIPVFCYRHYIQDGGKFPDHMMADLGMTGADLSSKRRECCPI